MKQSVDVLLVGGGVIGLTAAYFLAREGLRVRVVDKGDLGREASWAGAGIIPPGNPTAARSPCERLRALSSSLFPSLSQELADKTGVDNGYRRCGGLELSGTEASEEWRGEGVVAEAIDEAAARRLEPNLASGLGPAVHLPEMAQVRNPRHLKALIAACQLLGVELSPGCAVRALITQGERVEEVKTLDGVLHAKMVVLTSGAWTLPLLEPLGCRARIEPVRGQMALLQPGVPLLKRVVVLGSQYLVPRPDGRVLAGSTEENVGFDKRTTAAGIDGLLRLAMRLVPALADAPLERTWAGLRPGSPDGLPYLGPVPGCANLFVAAGHFRAGIQLSIGTGLVVKELILGQATSVPLEPFRLNRGCSV